MAPEGVESKRPAVFTDDIFARGRPGDEPEVHREIRAGDLAAPLLEFLRRDLDAPNLDYENAPTQRAGGGQALIFALSLSDNRNETEWGSVPLVCRISRMGGDHNQPPCTASPIGTVARFQQGLADLGYPAPRVVAASTHFDGIDVPFLVMERIKGKPISLYLWLILLIWPASTYLWRLAAYTRFEPLFTVLSPPIPAVVALSAFLFLLCYSVHALVRLHRLPVERLIDILADRGLHPEEVVFGHGILDRLDQQIRESGAEELAPGIQWLRAHLPLGNTDRVPCHLDHHPGNVMLNRWRTRGVIDWTTAMIAEPEYDIAWNRVVNIAAWFAVSAIPEPSRSVVGFVASSLLWTMERLQELLYRFRANVSAEKVQVAHDS